MVILFYIAAAVALVATVLALSRANAVHGILYFVVSLLATAFVFYILDAPFLAAFEVIIYAGAVMVLFLFVVMLVNLGRQSLDEERHLLTARFWMGPALLTVVLAAELLYILPGGLQGPMVLPSEVSPQEVGKTLLGPYLLGVEITSMLLLAGLIGAFHLARRPYKKEG